MNPKTVEKLTLKNRTQLADMAQQIGNLEVGGTPADGSITDAMLAADGIKATVTNLSQDVAAMVVCTQAQYDLLPASKTSDNTLYLITA